MVATYELLRADVLRGQARPEGLGAVIYHGLVDGLQLLCSSPGRSKTPIERLSVAQSTPPDRELIRLLTNMVLQTQAEVMHVY